MATKTYILNFLLIILSPQSFAQDDEQILDQWTKANELKFVEKYDLIHSQWFENECLNLAKLLRFNKINKCSLIKSPHINAYVFNNGHVYFSAAMVKLINNKHQLASILAHENAHVELSHYLINLQTLKNPPIFFPKSKYKKQLKKHEEQADAWAEKSLQRFGFDPTQISYFLKRVEELDKSHHSSTHLKISKRIKKKLSKEIINSEFGLIFE